MCMYVHTYVCALCVGKTRPTENELKLKELIRYFVESNVRVCVCKLGMCLYVTLFPSKQCTIEILFKW